MSEFMRPHQDDFPPMPGQNELDAGFEGQIDEYANQGVGDMEAYLNTVHAPEGLGAAALTDVRIQTEDVVPTAEQEAAPAVVVAEHVNLIGFGLEAVDQERVAKAVNAELHERGLPEQAAPALMVREAAQAVSPFNAENASFYGSEADRKAAAAAVIEAVEQSGNLSPRHKHLEAAYAKGEMSEEEYQNALFGEVITVALLKRGNVAAMGTEALDLVDGVLANMLRVDKDQLLDRVGEIGLQLKGMFYTAEQMKVAEQRFEDHRAVWPAEVYQHFLIDEEMRRQKAEDRKNKKKRNQELVRAKASAAKKADVSTLVAA